MAGITLFGKEVELRQPGGQEQKEEKNWAKKCSAPSLVGGATGFWGAMFWSAVFLLRRNGGGGEGAAHQPPLGLLLHPHLVGRDMILIQDDMLANLDDMSASVRSSLKQGEEGEWS